jgi:putative nucleotidyltransferase with HDIG domain
MKNFLFEKDRLESNDNKFDDRYHIFNQINIHLLNDDHPSDYLNTLSKELIFRQPPFSMLLKLKETAQSPIYHPEGNVWNHTILVVDEAAKVKSKCKKPEIFMWAALLHDIGKPDTTKVRKGRITAYNHDVVGAELAKEFLQFFPCNEDFIQEVVNLIRWHMHILYVLKDLPFSEMKKLKSEVDIYELSLLGYCDRVGRKNSDKIKEQQNINSFLEKMNHV